MTDGDKSRYSAKILFALGLGTAFSLLGDATLYAVLPTHTTDAGITLAVVGILLGINRAVRLVFNSIAGWLYDRFSQRYLFICGLCIGAFSTACYAVARGFWVLFVGRVFWGMAWSLIWVGGGTLILNAAKETDRGRWTGFYQTWFFLGSGCGAFVGGVLTDQIGYYHTMWVAAMIQGLSAIVVLVLMPTISKKTEQEDPEGHQENNGTFLSHDLYLTVIFQGINRFCIPGVLYATLGLLVKERLASPGLLIGVATLTGILIAARTLVSMIVAPLAGHLSDVLGNRWRVMSYAFVLGVAAMILLGLHSPVYIVAGVLCGAVITSAVQSLTITLTGDLVGVVHRGKAISLLHTMGDLGSAIGPPSAYALLFKLGLTGIYLFCAGLFAVAFCLIVVRRTAPPQ